MATLTRHIVDLELPHVRSANGCLVCLTFCATDSPTTSHCARLLESDAPDALADDASALTACYEGAILQRLALWAAAGTPCHEAGSGLVGCNPLLGSAPRAGAHIDAMTLSRYVARMAEAKRATVYFETDVHRALRLKAAETERSVSELVNEAVRAQLSEDADDLAPRNA